ncbi:MAG: hypothetical protein GX443_13035 [Deltaproteobacteria bacterium]|nr:hypothetical protein [Deltaproteobacteria bacterium]
MKARCKGLVTLFTFFVLLGFHSSPMAFQRSIEENQYALWNAVATRAVKEARNLMGAPHPQDAVVLTNAGYAVVEGLTTEPCLDGLRQWEGATAGKRSLLEVHSARNSALWFFFFNRRTGQGVYYELKGQNISWIIGWLEYFRAPWIRRIIAALPTDQLFGEPAYEENILAEHLLANQANKDAWNDKVAAKVFGGREFAIVTIANGIAHGTPYDLIKSVQFHDHYCPGVTSGYLLANYLEKNFPLLVPGSAYFVLSIPPWCKDDALQILLNTTPGKSGYAVFYLSAADKGNLREEAKDLAGVFFRKNQSGKWEGVVLGFSFAKIEEMGGPTTAQGYAWESRLAMDLWLLDYLDQPELFINVIKTFELQQGAPSDWARVGVDPLDAAHLDLWKPASTP